jgi:hypothetical protein
VANTSATRQPGVWKKRVGRLATVVAAAILAVHVAEEVIGAKQLAEKGVIGLMQACRSTTAFALSLALGVVGFILLSGSRLPLLRRLRLPASLVDRLHLSTPHTERFDIPGLCLHPTERLHFTLPSGPLKIVAPRFESGARHRRSSLRFRPTLSIPPRERFGGPFDLRAGPVILQSHGPALDGRRGPLSCA